MSSGGPENSRKKKREDERVADSKEVMPAPVPPPKRLKSASKRTPCLLADFGPEIMSHILSFLTLKDGLEVPRTCRQLHNNATTTIIFRYCFLMEEKACCREGHGLRSLEKKYLDIQKSILCNPVSIDNLRAALRNATLPSTFRKDFIRLMAEKCKTDDAHFMEALIQDGRCQPDIEDLDELLKKDFANMAAVLVKHDDVKKDIVMCARCPDRISCYGCPNQNLYCDDKLWYCRQCVLNNNLFCVCCSNAICPECVRQKAFFTCIKCHDVGCCFVNCQIDFYTCGGCSQVKCSSCISADREQWVPDVEDDIDHPFRCPSCQKRIALSATTVAN